MREYDYFTINYFAPNIWLNFNPYLCSVYCFWQWVTRTSGPLDNHQQWPYPMPAFVAHRQAWTKLYATICKDSWLKIDGIVKASW